MGKALAQALSGKNQLFLYDRTFEKATLLMQEGFGLACRTVDEAVSSAETIVLAVKPQNLMEVGALIKENVREEQIIVSLLAGTSLESLRNIFANCRIVRMMPNLAVIHGEGVIGLSSNDEVEKCFSETFEPLGKVYLLPEEKMDALTALTGSGPAFFFSIVEAMIDAGIAMGFTAKDAQGLVYQMLQGSLTLLANTSKHPGELRWQIASPQGTTIAGLKKLEELALRGAVMNTFFAAYEHSSKSRGCGRWGFGFG